LRRIFAREKRPSSRKTFAWGKRGTGQTLVFGSNIKAIARPYKKDDLRTVLMLKKHLWALLGTIVLATSPATTGFAKQSDTPSTEVRIVEVSRADVKKSVEVERARLKRAKPSRIWCVPFARAVSGIEIRGDAKTWWKKAGTTYPKGKVPVSGSVLTFRASGGMTRGHVAVVSGVINSREILVDQANWVTNRVTLDTKVVDVSPNNDWSAVRVANSASSFGRVYPTYGFIYRPHDGDA
jgi:surface antigen